MARIDPKARLRKLLRRFHERAGLADSAEQRLKILIDYADIVVTHDAVVVTQWRRKLFAKERTSLDHVEDLDIDLVCFVCWRVPEHWHHVIQLQHGGANWKTNLVPLCQTCHRGVHPWTAIQRQMKARRLAIKPSKKTPVHKKEKPMPLLPSVRSDMTPRLVKGFHNP